MTTKWRPQNWGNINPLYGLKTTSDYLDAIGKAYECGADAMLEKILTLIAELDDRKYKDLFAYGGPGNCEHNCLPGLEIILKGEFTPDKENT